MSVCLAKSARDFVVVVEEGRLVGVVTEHDLLRLAIDHLPAGAVLEPSAPVASVGTRTPADAALEIQRRLGFRHLVVEDEDAVRKLAVRILEAAGYTSQMIPLFMRPAADGRASGRQIQGSIKGPGAVAEITPRLRRLIAD